MELAGVTNSEIDFLPEGIDNTLYTESSNVCKKANASIPIENPETTDSDPIPVVGVQFILTSIRTGDCLDMR